MDSATAKRNRRLQAAQTKMRELDLALKLCSDAEQKKEILKQLRELRQVIIDLMNQ